MLFENWNHFERLGLGFYANSQDLIPFDHISTLTTFILNEKQSK